MQLWLMKTTHHWLGVLFAAFFFVIALSGVWLTVERYTLPALFDGDMRMDARALSADEAMNAVQTLYKPNVTQIDFPIDRRAVYTVYQAGAAEYYSQDLQPLGSMKPPSFAARLHGGLLNFFGIGPSIVVWTAMVGAWISVLGLLIAMPQWRGFRKNRLLVPHEMSFRDVRRTHLSSGLVFFIFVFFFSISGWTLGAPKDAQAIFLTLDSPRSEVAVSVQNGAQKSLKDTIGEAARIALQQTENAQPTRLRIYEDKVDIYLSSAGDLSARGHNLVSLPIGALDGASAGMSARRGGFVQLSAKDLSLAARLVGSFDSLHTGKGMHVLYQLLICLLGIAIALIAMTGLLSYYLKWKIKIAAFLARRRKAKRNVQNES